MGSQHCPEGWLAALQSVVQFGLIQGGDSMEALLRLMSGLYVPSVLSSTNWPESVKKDFTGQLHKFMANLTETVYGMKGKTVLYTPQEDLQDPVAAAKDKVSPPS